MPIYEYECTACGIRFERMQRISDEPARECEKCGGSVRRLISSPGIQFKGSGWYVTDYSNKLKGPSDSSPSSPPEKKTEPAAPAGKKTDN